MWGWIWKKKPDARIEEAERELARAEADHQMVVDRRPLIDSIVTSLREAREVNHFAERLNAAYGWKR